jgi:hypothetical protein
VSKRVFLHVGSPKTGTTFLQHVLWSQREAAHAQGLLLPLDSFFDHYLASLDVRGLSARHQHPSRAVGIWDRLAEEVADWPDTALVSHELFAAASAEEAQRAIASLGDTEVHVVVTARDFVRQIPAEWQEHVKHRSVLGFADFIDELMRDRAGETWFWRVQDTPEVLRRWGQTLPRSQVHVVVVPPAGAEPALLWQRFAGMLGLDGEAFDLAASRPNTSLHAEQAELLRRVNGALGDRLRLPGPYPEMVKNVFAHQVLADRPGTPFGLSDAAMEFAVQRSKEMAASLGDLGVDVVGDLAELVPLRSLQPLGPNTAEGQTPRMDPDAVPPESLLGEAVAAVADLLVVQHKERWRLGAAERELTEALNDTRAQLEGARSERDRLVEEMSRRPLRHLLRGLSHRWGWLMRVREWYRDNRDRARERRKRRGQGSRTGK